MAQLFRKAILQLFLRRPAKNFQANLKTGKLYLHQIKVLG